MAAVPMKRFGLLGHYGTQNLGDEAIIAAVLENLRARCSRAEFYGISANPCDTTTRHKIPAYPICRLPSPRPSAWPGGPVTTEPRARLASSARALRSRLRRVPPLHALLQSIKRVLDRASSCLREVPFLLGSYRVVKRLDLLIVSGSGQLSDHFGGPWNMPYNLFRWSILAKVAGTRLIFMSVGAGPIAHFLSRFFIKSALSMADYRSVRDRSSQELLERIGVRGEKGVVPDLAWSLAVPAVKFTGAVGPSLRVGVNVFPHRDPRYWPLSDAAAYESYVAKIARFVLWLTERRHRVALFPTQASDPLVIEDVVAEAIRACPTVERRLARVGYVAQVEGLVEQMSTFDVVVATRFHGTLLALSLNKPVLAIANHHKTADLMTALGQGEYVLDIEHCDLEALTGRFLSLETALGAVTHTLQERSEECRRAIAAEYERVLSLVDARERSPHEEAMHGDRALGRTK